ncbi:MAG: hypothetical protein AB7F43_08100 [Bacteriovoracia bacterium]
MRRAKLTVLFLIFSLFSANLTQAKERPAQLTRQSLQDQIDSRQKMLDKLEEELDNLQTKHTARGIVYYPINGVQFLSLVLAAGNTLGFLANRFPQIPAAISGIKLNPTYPNQEAFIAKSRILAVRYAKNTVLWVTAFIASKILIDKVLMVTPHQMELDAEQINRMQVEIREIKDQLTILKDTILFLPQPAILPKPILPELPEIQPDAQTATEEAPQP